MFMLIDKRSLVARHFPVLASSMLQSRRDIGLSPTINILL